MILFLDSCGHSSNCLEYDNAQLTMVLVSLLAVCKLIAMSSFFVTWFLCRKQRKHTEFEMIEL